MIPKYDAIIIPLGGVKDGMPQEYVKARLNRSIELKMRYS